MNITTQEQQHFIATKSGKIAAYINEVQTDELPVSILQRVYIYNPLWETHVEEIKYRLVITVNMSLHGLSKKAIQVNY